MALDPFHACLPRWCRIVRDRTACESAEPYERRHQARDAAALVPTLRWLSDEETERFVCVYLDGRNRVITSSVVSVGTLTASLVHPREVFRLAIALNAAAVVLAHNHPSGDPAPSPEDVALTARLREAGTLLGIRVLDHIVMGERGRFVAFAEWQRW